MTEQYTYTNERELRLAFWRAHRQFLGYRHPQRTQNQYPADVRMAWVDFVDSSARAGDISEWLASRVTL